MDTINKAFQLLASPASDSLGLAVLYQKGLLHLQQIQNDSFFDYNKLLHQNSKALNNNYFQGKATFNLGYYFDEMGKKPDSAYYYYTLSKNAFLVMGDSSQAGRRLLRMGIAQKNQNDFYGAKETLTEAIECLTRSKDKKYLASAYSELGTSNQKLLNPNDAIGYYGKAISISPKPKDILAYKNNLALVYQDQKRHAKAVTF